jgi:hypothetical protein
VSRTASDRLAVPVAAVHWILLSAGLVWFAASRIDAPAPIAPLCLGAVGGTVLGQMLALRDIRLWLTALITAAVVWLGGPVIPAGLDAGLLWQAFVPAALCGYWSLGDRGALAACWFPAVLWLLAILDRTDGVHAIDGGRAALLGGFALVFLVVLRARESRRVALWRTVAPVPLAVAAPPTLLRKPPGLELVRTGWAISIAAITVALTAWIAPRLWRVEPVRRIAKVASLRGLPAIPCCPRDLDPPGGSRVSEYLDLGRLPGEQPARAAATCRACGASALAGAGTGAPSQRRTGDRAVAAISRAAGPMTADDGTAPVLAPVDPGQPAPRSLLGRPAPDQPSPGAARASALSAPRGSEPAAQASAPAIAQPTRSTITADAPNPAALHAGAAPPPRENVRSAPILPWVLALAAAAVIVQLAGLALRPLRRIVTLRHLRQPLWDETVDQRISNLWQLALVGLRDAGWRATPDESPQALARRVAIDSLARAATILERARHGLGIDPEDLEAMRSSADEAYRAARAGLGGFARAASWLRWPLT